MNRRRIMLAFALYVTLDLSSPFVPGSFNFEPDQCVEAIQCASSPELPVTTVATRFPVARLVVPPPPPMRPAGDGHRLLEWLVASHENTRAAGEPPPPSEDH